MAVKQSNRWILKQIGKIFSQIGRIGKFTFLKGKLLPKNIEN